MPTLFQRNYKYDPNEVWFTYNYMGQKHIVLREKNHIFCSPDEFFVRLVVCMAIGGIIGFIMAGPAGAAVLATAGLFFGLCRSSDLGSQYTDSCVLKI